MNIFDNRIIRGIILRIRRCFPFALAIVTLAMAAVRLPSGRTEMAVRCEILPLSREIGGAVGRMKREALADVYEIPLSCALPWNTQPVYGPNPALFDGNNYHDETIDITYWSERIDDTTVHFAEVSVADPSQLRTAWAGREPMGGERYSPKAIAADIGAVIAINGDFAGYHDKGVIWRQGRLYRGKPCGADLLMIDYDGNFHIASDYDWEYLSEIYQIVNSLEFGPALVIDGVISCDVTKSILSAQQCEYLNPRTAVGQLAPLRYLLCCCEGREEGNWGLSVARLAKVMLDKGCVQAYNLDGGGSTSMVIGERVVNSGLDDGSRSMSDILFFASAANN